MLNNICSNCNAQNNQDAVSCVNCGSDIQDCSQITRQHTSKKLEKGHNETAVISFVLSLIPPNALVIFMLHLSLARIGVTSGDSILLFMGLILLMLLLGLILYIGSYALSISALALAIIGRKSEKKRFAVIAIIISIFNFSIPFLISPINELFLR